MRVENKILNLTVDEFIKILNDNEDKSQENNRINGILITIIKENRNKLTPKQRKWVNQKLIYIISRNRNIKKMDYVNISKFNDFLIIKNDIENNMYTRKEVSILNTENIGFKF